MLSIGWIAMSYVLGSIPFGLLVGKIMCGIDPRQDGSCNTGATNVARLCGFKYGVLAMLLDMAKGFVPVAMAMSFSDSSFFLGLTACAAVFGHAYSVFLHFKGGKAVATTVGVFAALAPWSTLGAVLLFIVTTALGGYVSLGSLVLATSLVVFLLISLNWGLAFWAFVIMCLIYWRHRENIERLRLGEENSWRKS